MDRDRQLPAHGVLVTGEIQCIDHKKLRTRLERGQHAPNLHVLRIDRKLNSESNKPCCLVVGRRVAERTRENTCFTGCGSNRSQDSCQPLVEITENVVVQEIELAVDLFYGLAVRSSRKLHPFEQGDLLLKFFDLIADLCTPTARFRCLPNISACGHRTQHDSRQPHREETAPRSKV